MAVLFHKVTPRLNISGAWPSPIAMGRGWARALARPWNDDSGLALLRLQRGNASFLREASVHLADIGAETVLSPPLYPSSVTLWRRAGFEERHRLRIMERAVTGSSEPPQAAVCDESLDAPLDEMTRLDRRAFAGMWRMSSLGLSEALKATGRSAVLVTREEGCMTGYALVGAEWGVAYLQRLAVDPQHQGSGLGTELLRAAIEWARHRLTRVIVLNVRPDNLSALHLYRREGFAETGVDLRLVGRSG